MHAGTNLTFSSATVQSNQVTVSANGSATASSSWVYPKVEVVNTASGSYQTPPKTGITPRTMPDATAFDYYIANGTPITYASILKSGGQVTLEKDFLSPNRNPYGVTNAKGIYVINCLLGDLRIRNFRIVGTLVILNPGVFSVQQAVNWEPGIANYPSLLVRGNAELAFSSGALSESSLGVNFNEDTNKTDTYPSLNKGLVYASGNVTTKTSVTIDGVLVIGGTLTAQNTLTLTYESTFLDNPPPGFAGAPEMVISPGTWKQLVD